MNEQTIAQENLIYKIRIGSTLYGTLTATSDEDMGGIFVPTKDYVIGTKRVEQVELSEKISKSSRNQKGDTDFVIYNIVKFIELATGNNPNIVEYFFAPTPCVLFCNDFGQRLREAYPLFISKKAYHTFKGYAYGQRQKLMVKRENMTGRTELAEKFGYDTKFASHLIRLLLEGHQILVEKRLTFPLPQNNLVRDIKVGKYELSWVLNKADELEKLVDLAYTSSDLQYTADFEKINHFQMQLLEDFWSKNNLK